MFITVSKNVCLEPVQPIPQRLIVVISILMLFFFHVSVRQLLSCLKLLRLTCLQDI
jgi:hypothetical protein